MKYGLSDSEFDKRVEHYTDLLEGAIKGNWTARAKLKESLSTSDFAVFYREIANAQLLNQYAEAASTQGLWKKVARRVTVNNFLPQAFYEYGIDDSGYDQLLAKNGGRKTTKGKLPNVPEGTEYPTGLLNLFASEEQLQVRKAGTRAAATFEAIINDQWNVIASLPGKMKDLAYDSEDIEVTELLTDGDGPNEALFNDVNGNLLKYGTNADGTAALTRDTLKAALKQANTRKAGPNGTRPVTFNKFAVVIPQALYEVSEDIKAMPTQFIVNDGAVQYTDTFTIPQNYEFVVDPWLDQIDTEHGETAWYVTPWAGEGTRLSLALGFLTGEETPELRLHNLTGVYFGGGQVAPTEGSFRADDWELRIRHIYGGAAMNNGLGTVASTGEDAPTTI